MRFLIGAALLSLLAGCAQSAGAHEQRLVVSIEHSRFEPSTVEVDEGSTVTFVIHNTDPIDHEFILGDQEVQDLHETGIGHHHGEIPGEVSVPAGETRTTTYTFDEPGRLIIGCHLPGHFRYGMRALVTVTS